MKIGGVGPVLLLVLVVAGCAAMRIGDYPADTDEQGWKDWMVDNCPGGKYKGLVPENFDTDFTILFVDQKTMPEVCGAGNAACYLPDEDVIYLPDDGGAFLYACHELAHARGGWSHEPQPIKRREEDPRERYLWEDCDGDDPNNPCPDEFPGGG